MKISSFGTMTCMVAMLCAAAAAAAGEQRLLREIAAAPDPVQLQATVKALVGFGTRHTLSDTTSPKRGIGAARRWAQARFIEIARDCGGCLSVVTPSRTFTGESVPTPTQVVDVVAIQKGTGDPERVILLTAHIDSRVSDIMNSTVDAPGADDDASGVAVVIEAARILSRYKFPATLVYGVLSGEEQDLYGGRVLAQYAKAQGWRVEADLNNDIVGGTRGQNGVVNVALIYRLDRVGRGGDHWEFNALGYPAVRFTENAEDYRHQHQDLRVEGGVEYGDTIAHVDFAYLGKVAATNALAAASLASAPPPPANVEAHGEVTPDTQLTWTAAPGQPSAGFLVHWRDTTEPAWSHARDAGKSESLTLTNIPIDDFIFGVASVSADGFESPVVSGRRRRVLIALKDCHVFIDRSSGADTPSRS